MNLFKDLKSKNHKPTYEIKELLKYVGPGLLVTVGFIDPGNWASNIAAGSEYGYSLLWMITLSTIMLIILQHNVAHLGIVTGDCLAESANRHLKPKMSKFVLSTAILAAISTALAEILGAAIALELLFKIPIKIGSFLTLIVILWMLFAKSYKHLEKWIIGFVSLIGLSFIYELSLVDVNWSTSIHSWTTISFPKNSMPIIMAVLGAVVMPHNLFLHSEIIQSRQWNLENEEVKQLQLKYEFTDTLVSMGIGWAINSSMIILAATTFFVNHIKVEEIGQAQKMLSPLLGPSSGLIFAIALLLAGIASTTTAGMAGGTIFAGLFGEPYDIDDNHTKLGVSFILGIATVLILFIKNPFDGLIYSQMFLSIQLPITVFLQIYLTSSEKVMGKYKNSKTDKISLWVIGIILTILNLLLIKSYLFN